MVKMRAAVDVAVDKAVAGVLAQVVRNRGWFCVFSVYTCKGQESLAGHSRCISFALS